VATELQLYLEQLRECSLSIIDIIEKEAYDALESKISERQEIIDSISKLNFAKEEINRIAEALEIVPLSEKINNRIVDKRNLIKRQIETTATKKRANSNYNKSFYDNYHVFSKKI
jgi:hypothetical protein